MPTPRPFRLHHCLLAALIALPACSRDGDSASKDTTQPPAQPAAVGATAKPQAVSTKDTAPATTKTEAERGDLQQRAADQAAATENGGKATPASAAADVAPEVKPLDLDAALKVRRLVVARGVKGREPVSASKAFAASKAKRVYAFVEVSNKDKAESQIFVSFVPPGRSSAPRIKLRVGQSPRWRTWAFTRNAKKLGTWQAVVHDGRGRVLARKPFEIVDPNPLTTEAKKTAEKTAEAAAKKAREVAAPKTADTGDGKTAKRTPAASAVSES